jgi:hypothetical protein
MTPVKSVESGAHQMLNVAEAVGQPGQAGCLGACERGIREQTFNPTT